MSFKKSILTAATIAVVGVTGSIYAGSYSAPPVSPMPMGNWYVNGFGGAGWVPNNNIRANHLSAIPPNPRVSFETGYDLGGAIGYRTGPWRGEVQYTYMRSSVDKVGTFGPAQPEPPAAPLPFFPGGSVEGRAVVHAVMANGFYDFNTISDYFSPYIGVGIGWARVNGRAGTAPVGVNLRDNVFAYQGMAGVNYNVDNSFTVDIGYRYFATKTPDFLAKRYQNHLLNLGITYHIPA